MTDFPDYAQLGNLSLIEDQYRRYVQDPNSVDVSWRHFFEGIDFARVLDRQPLQSGGGSNGFKILLLIQAYRRYGHLQARTNPLQDPKEAIAELDLEKLGFTKDELAAVFPTFGFCGKETATLQEIVAALKETYASRIGIEYLDLGNPELEKWIQEKLEPQVKIELSLEEKRLLLDMLNQSEVLEKFLHTRYVGQTRFSLEGNETAIPVLAEMIDLGAHLGIDEFWIGMAHRGRLNVLANILRKPYSKLFEKFEDDTALAFFGNDDVKYHMGFFQEIETKNKKKIWVGLPPNPSHLESVDPVLLGQVRARQSLKKDEARKKCVPIMIHGDAALAGQGVVYESLQLANLPDYTVGGTIHIVLNNQIGYTTLPKEGRSTKYCTDIAKAFGIPVIHVNAEDPESCLVAAKLAIEIRQQFQCDVFLDLIGYRKYGHNEGDEPSYTQPIEYQKIRSKQTIRDLYFETLMHGGLVDKKLAEELDIQYQKELQSALESAQAKEKSSVSLEKKKNQDLFKPISTGLKEDVLKEITEGFCKVPSSFHLHPKLQKQLQERQKMDPIDWASAEALAVGSLLIEGIPVRLAGQDSKRGTFSQRHFVWTDVENGSFYCSLQALRENQARLEVVNSPLTEYAGMGFEYGYSCGDPKALVLWEAQYGDFNNGAQIVIDQYIASAEQKWSASSSLVLLLPHAYEGAGPEHSSARLERFLQLSALDNIQIVNPSTPAQYFHLLRRQALREIKKPLIVLTPKGLLRSRACTNPIKDLTCGHFLEVLDDPMAIRNAKRLILCSGKVFYDLIAEREKQKLGDIAIVRIEQFYPVPIALLSQAIEKYKGISECFWVQEEPQNMGAWSFLSPILQSLLPKSVSFSYIGRSANATAATGSHVKHKQEQAALIRLALQGQGNS